MRHNLTLWSVFFIVGAGVLILIGPLLVPMIWPPYRPSATPPPFATAADGTPEPGVSGWWYLVDGRVDNELIRPLADHPVSLALGQGRVSGNASCNDYRGDLRVAGESIHVENLVLATVGCSSDVQRVEHSYLRALVRASSVTIEDDGRIVLTGGGSQLLFSKHPPLDFSAVVDREWFLIGSTDGSVEAAGASAQLAIRADGTLEASSGCRLYSGRYSPNPSGISVTELSASGECPRDLRAADALLAAILGDQIMLRLEGDRLIVSTQGSIELVFGRGEAGSALNL